MKCPDGASGIVVGATGLQGSGGRPRGLDCQGDPSTHEDQSDPGVPAGLVTPVDPDGPSGEDEVGPSVPYTLCNVRGPEGDAVPSPGVPTSRLLEFSLTIPFRSRLEAEMARRALAPYAECYRGLIQKEFTVKGRFLAVWTAKDTVLFRVSVNYFLEQLSVVMRNIRTYGPSSVTAFNQGEGAQA